LIVANAAALPTPEVAVIVTVPFEAAVTKPADETVAIVVSDDAHVTVAPATIVPSVSFTVAVSVVVSANEAKLTLVCDSVTDAAA
jgi:hypothetical protein